MEFLHLWHIIVCQCEDFSAKDASNTNPISAVRLFNTIVNSHPIWAIDWLYFTHF